MSWGEIQDPSRDATKDASANQPVVQGVPIAQAKPKPKMTSYFTDGEMLPWKGKWFRLRLVTLTDGQQVLCLDMIKDTASAEKKIKRAERWQKQHPKANGKPRSHTSRGQRLAQV